jgi:hypothetical protein
MAFVLHGSVGILAIVVVSIIHRSLEASFRSSPTGNFPLWHTSVTLPALLKKSPARPSLVVHTAYHGSHTGHLQLSQQQPQDEEVDCHVKMPLLFSYGILGSCQSSPASHLIIGHIEVSLF